MAATVQLAERRPLLAPFERIHTAFEDGDRFVFSPKRAKRLALPADYQNDKLKWWNQKNALTSGSPLKEVEYGLATILINSGSSAYLHKTYGTPSLLINPTVTWDKENHKMTVQDFFLDNDLEETNSIVIYDDDETLWTAYQEGTGSYGVTLSEELTEKVKGTSSLKATVGAGTYASVGFQRDYTSAQDWSTKEFVCFYFRGANSGLTIHFRLIDSSGNWREWDFTDNFTGWKRFVRPLRTGTSESATAPNLAQVDIIRFYWAPTGAVTFYLDRTVIDVGQWVKVEVYVPDVLSVAGQKWALYAYDQGSGAYRANPFLKDNAYSEAELQFLDGTLQSQILVAGKGGARYAEGMRGQSKSPGGDTSAGNMTYSSNYGCVNRIGFAIKMPPDDGQDSSIAGISQVRLKLEVNYEGALTVRDSSGRANHGTRYGALEVMGRVGKALSFDGVDDKVVIPANPIFNFTNVLSVFAWVYKRVENVNQVIACQRSWSSPARGWIFHADESTGKLNVVLINQSFSLYAATPLPPNQLHYVGFVWNRPTLKLYVDSNLVSQSEWDNDIYDPSDLIISVGSEYSGNYLNGFLDEFRVYKRALSASEILDLYNGIDIRDGLVLHLSFEDDWDFGRTTYEFENSTNQFYGLQNLNDSWLAFFDQGTKDCEFLILTKRPLGLKVGADENELIDRVELTLAKGTVVYAGQIVHGDLTRDSDGDGVPDFLEEGEG